MAKSSGVIRRSEFPEVYSDSAAYYGQSEADRPSPKGVHRTLAQYAESDNVAEELSEGRLSELGDKVRREYEVDKNSRSEWEERNEEAMDLAKQVYEEKNYPWPGAANIKFPLLTTASIQFAARAYPAIISGRNVVKGVVQGSDEGTPAQPQQGMMGLQQGQPAAPGQPQMPPGAAQMEPQEQQWQVEPGAKRERADRVGRHMSWQLLDKMEEWEEDTDRLLHVLPIVGHAFRKTWYDPGLGRNRSELVTVDKCVVNMHAKSLETVPRVTQVFELYPHEIEERQRMGLYLDAEFGCPTDAEANDDSAPHEFLEQHRYEDLDEDGYPEPYVVTIHKDTSKVARIVARFGLDDVYINNANEVARIEPTHYFTDYRFIPSPDGTYYGIGFGELLKPLNESINTTINQMLDAGHLQNTGGGFIGSGLRIKGGDTRFRPGEYKRADATGGTIKDNIVPLQHSGPSQTLFNLLGLLIEAARDITSVKDVMTGGEGPQNEAATRTLARIEQGMKVFSAIYKRVYRSLKQEYRKLYRLNRQHLEDRQYFSFHDDPEAVGREDYADDLDVAPAADPNMITDQQKAAQAEYLMQFLNDPVHDQLELRKRIHEAIGVPDYDQILADQPPPNPETEIEQRKVAVDEFKAETERIKTGHEIGKIRAETMKAVTEARKVAQEAEGAQAQQMLDGLDKIQDNIRQFEELDYKWASLEHDREMKERDVEQRDRSDERRVRGMGQSSGNTGGSGAPS